MNTVQIAQVIDILEGSNLAVKTAMVILLSYQTREERAIGATTAQNGKGFSYSTQRKGTYFARWCLGLTPHSTDQQMANAIERYLSLSTTGRAQFGNSLSGRFVEQARRIAMSHRRQLIDLLPLDQRFAAPPTPPRTQRSGFADPRLNRSYDELPVTVRYGAV